MILKEEKKQIDIESDDNESDSEVSRESDISDLEKNEIFETMILIITMMMMMITITMMMIN